MNNIDNNQMLYVALNDVMGGFNDHIMLEYSEYKRHKGADRNYVKKQANS